jgi:hypothetical protein
MPRRPLRTIAVAITLLLAGRAAAMAQGVSLSRAGSGARAAGMADAFVAVSDDGTAASWNPAGLGQLRQPEFSFVYAMSQRAVGLSGLRSRDDAVAYTITDPLDSVSSSVDFVSAALPFSMARRPVTLQVSWRRLYQLDNAFGGDIRRYATTDLRTPVSSAYLEDRLDGSIDVITAAGALKLTSRTAIGASVDFWRGGWKNSAVLVEQPAAPAETAFMSLNAATRLRGRNASVGLLLTYPAWNAGLVYHAPFWSSVTNSTSVRSSAVSAEDARVTGKFQFPRSISAGVAWRPAAHWTAAAAVTHDQWTEALVAIQGAGGPVNFFDNLPPDLSSTRDTVSLNLGVEHLFVRDAAIVPFRLGVGWEPQGQMDTVTRDPVDYLLFSGGTGYNTNRFKLDAAVQLRRATARASAALTVESATSGDTFTRDAYGQGKNHEWRIKVSAIYRLQDTTKLKGILCKIFG